MTEVSALAEQSRHVEVRPHVRGIASRCCSVALPTNHHHLLPSPTDWLTCLMIVDGPHFQATDEGELIFLLTDGDNSRRPTEHDIVELDEESTLRDNYYLRIPLDHPDSHRWRAEIAKYLAPLVLGGKSAYAYAPRIVYSILEMHAHGRTQIDPMTTSSQQPRWAVCPGHSRPSHRATSCTCTSRRGAPAPPPSHDAISCSTVRAPSLLNHH